MARDPGIDHVVQLIDEARAGPLQRRRADHELEMAPCRGWVVAEVEQRAAECTVGGRTLNLVLADLGEPEQLVTELERSGVVGAQQVDPPRAVERAEEL